MKILTAEANEKKLIAMNTTYIREIKQLKQTIDDMAAKLL